MSRMIAAPCEVVETRCHSSPKDGSRALMRKSMILQVYVSDDRILRPVIRSIRSENVTIIAARSGVHYENQNENLRPQGLKAQAPP